MSRVSEKRSVTVLPKSRREAAAAAQLPTSGTTAPSSQPDSRETKPEPPRAEIPRANKLELFIQMCQQGISVNKALKACGILNFDNNSSYDPSDPVNELSVEDLYYNRCAHRGKLISDATYESYQLEEKQAHRDRGDITFSELCKLTDWLYFVRGLPLKAIATSLNVPVTAVMQVKAALSNDYAKAVRLQNADSYVADLLRTKDLLRADLLYRKGQIGPGHPQQIMLDRTLWEIENKFFDRLQEIGLIDKNLGRTEVHEEWHVSIGAAGQPVNTKAKEIPASLDSDSYFDAEVITVPQEAVSLEKEQTPITNEQLLGAVASIGGNPEQFRAAISVGDNSENSENSEKSGDREEDGDLV